MKLPFNIVLPGNQIFIRCSLHHQLNPICEPRRTCALQFLNISLAAVKRPTVISACCPLLIPCGKSELSPKRQNSGDFCILCPNQSPKSTTTGHSQQTCKNAPFSPLHFQHLLSSTKPILKSFIGV